MKNAVYLDYNATTPLKPDVITLMQEVMGCVGNASSVHSFGRDARRCVETAREQVAAMVGTHPNQVTFTSGATESNNAVLKHFAGQRILVCATEHPSVRVCLPPGSVEFIPVTKDGLVDMAAFEAMLEDGDAPALISVMMVNNETGVIQPVADIAKKARARHKDVFIHTDAVQASGRIKIDFPALHVDFMSLSAHKCGGPQGVGALICAPGTPSVTFMHGGGQEKRQRAGTENVAGIAGFGKAAELAVADLDKYHTLAPLRDRLEAEILKAAPDAQIFGKNAPRTSNTTALCYCGIPAETQLMNLDLAGIAVSSGSACSSGAFKPSPVLQAMGANNTQASCTLRISMGWGTQPSDVERFIDAWTSLYQRLRPEAKEAV